MPRRARKIGTDALVRYGAAGATGLLLAWLVVSSGMAAVMRADPRAALQYRSTDARALGEMAARTLSDGGEKPQEAKTARLQALEALSRDVTVVTAWRTLAATDAVENNVAGANKLFHIAEGLSRRDLPTQMWLIEERVQAGDVGGALRHYDAALRTSRASYDLLIPVLVSATADPGVVEPLVSVLAAKPEWRPAFLSALADAPPSPQNALRLVADLRKRAPIEETETIGFMAQRLVASKSFGEAWQLYAIAKGVAGQPAQTLRNGEFNEGANIAPFDWQLEVQADYGAEYSRSDAHGGGSVLHVYAGSAGGPVATQLLSLQPGAYSLTTRAGTMAESASPNLRWTAKCENGGSQLATIAMTQLSEVGKVFQANFVVPANCPVQWLSLDIANTDTSRQADAWVDATVIRRIK